MLQIRLGRQGARGQVAHRRAPSGRVRKQCAPSKRTRTFHRPRTGLRPRSFRLWCHSGQASGLPAVPGPTSARGAAAQQPATLPTFPGCHDALRGQPREAVQLSRPRVVLDGRRVAGAARFEGQCLRRQLPALASLLHDRPNDSRAFSLACLQNVGYLVRAAHLAERSCCVLGGVIANL